MRSSLSATEHLSPFESPEAAPSGFAAAEDPRYLREQLVTYIGSKRSFLALIGGGIGAVERKLGRPPVALDAFAGSGVVSRLLKGTSAKVIANDLEPYSAALAACYLADREEVPWDRLRDAIAELNATASSASAGGGFIERLYAPVDDDAVRKSERVFCRIPGADLRGQEPGHRSARQCSARGSCRSSASAAASTSPTAARSSTGSRRSRCTAR